MSSFLGRAMRSTFRGTGNALGAAIDFFMWPGMGNSAREAGELLGWVAGHAGDLAGAAGRAEWGAALNAAQRRQVQALIEAVEAAAAADDAPAMLALAAELSRAVPQHHMGPAWQSAALVELERYPEALQALEQATERGLADVDGHTLRAEILSGLGDHAGAVREWTALVEDPDSAPYALLCRAMSRLATGDVDAALRDADRAVDLTHEATAYAVRGDIHRARGDHVRGLADYNRADEISPHMPDLLQRRAELHELLGDAAAAEADRAAVRDASNLAPDDPPMVEARELLARLRRGGVQVGISLDGRDLELRGTSLRPETVAAIRRLKPQLLALTRAEPA